MGVWRVRMSGLLDRRIRFWNGLHLRLGPHHPRPLSHDLLQETQ